MTAWRKERLGALCEITIGKTPTRARPDFWGPGHPWLSIADMSQGRYLSVTSETITDQALKEARHREVAPGTILMSFKLSIGKLGIAQVPMYTNEAIAHLPIRPGQALLPEYLYWALSATTLTHGADRAAMGSTLNSAKLKEIEIPLPPIPQQQQIAKVLDQAESLRSMRRATVDALANLKSSVFLEMFASQASEAWPITTIEGVAAASLGSIRTGPFGSQLLHSEFVDSGVAVLGIDNAVDNEFRWARPRYVTQEKYKSLIRYTVHPGDVLITIMGTCGRCAIVPDHIPLAINTKHLCCITLDQTSCLPAYLHSYFLHHPLARHYLTQTAKGAVMDGLNMEIIRQVPLRLPPLSLQQRFHERLVAIESMCKTHATSANELDNLFASLQQRAFRGEL